MRSAIPRFQVPCEVGDKTTILGKRFRKRFAKVPEERRPNLMNRVTQTRRVTWVTKLMTQTRDHDQGGRAAKPTPDAVRSAPSRHARKTSFGNLQISLRSTAWESWMVMMRMTTRTTKKKA